MPGPLELAAAVAVVVAFLGAVALVAPAARRRLGLLHPAVAWLALEGVFFGVGSVVLAVVDRVPGPALFTAGAIVAFGAGVRLADRLSQRRELPRPTTAAEARSAEDGGRRLVAPALAAVALLAILPTLLAVGLPILSRDVVAARTEITGFGVQLVRVALPALVATWLLGAAAGGAPLRRRAVAWLALALALGFTFALANRYLPLELAAVVVLAWLLSGRRLPARTALAAVVVAAVVFVGFGVVRATDRTGNGPLALAVERTTSRLFLVQPRTIAALQARIPAEEPYFLGATWLRRLGPLLDRDIPNLGYWIYPDVVPGAQSTPGYAAPGLLGEAWANFGPAGIGLFALFGVACERLGALVARRRERIVDVVAGAAAILFVARTHALGLLGVALLLALVAAWRWLAGRDEGLARDVVDAARWSLREPRAVPPRT